MAADIRSAGAAELAAWLGVQTSAPGARVPRPQFTGQRMYATARNPRGTFGWGMSDASADAELASSLTRMRASSRMLCRDAPYAKRARGLVQNNVIGTGIGLQAQVMMATKDELAPRINDAVEREWDLWMRPGSCHMGGALHFSDLERCGLGEIFEAGEVMVRLHRVALGESRVPLALELIEPERVPVESIQPAATAPGAEVRMGVEVDGFGKALAYWLRDRHPGDVRFARGAPERLTRVPADQIIHLRIINRWPQSRGEPWMHATAAKLGDMDGYSEAEIVAARGAASYMGLIETPDPNLPVGERQEDGTDSLELTPGMIPKLGPGEKFVGYSPNRPNSAMEAFMRLMLREACAGTGMGLSYESVSLDYSQSNYSSSRLAKLDERDAWRVLQAWWIRSFRALLHPIWVQAAVLARAIPEIPVEAFALDPVKFCAVKWKPRGWSWVDPAKEVAAYKEAERAGYISPSRVIANTADGADIEDIAGEIKRDNAIYAANGVKRDIELPAAAPPGTPTPRPDPDKDEDEGEPPAGGARIVNLR